jgi:glycerol-3-phosphate dehydrogenase
MLRRVDQLKDATFDLLVIGGGITGAGIALDASLRGLKVALVDKGDFAGGTSSVSSKLIHGGLRYLEQRHFGLVREALHERHTLLRIAPHLVRPLRIVLPHYAHARRPRWMVKTGLWLYDLLAGRERIGRHRWLAATEVVEAAPGLCTDGLRGGFEFYDAQMDDARLCLEVVMTAVDQGARAANYVEVVELRHNRAGGACGAEVLDRITGDCFGIAARAVVNAAGPWLDEVCRIDDAAAPSRVAPTKGVHLVLPAAGLAAGLLVTHPLDQRVMFILPWMNRTLVGTTDTFYAGRPDDVAGDDTDVDYLLAAANHYLARGWTAGDVIATLAGLRPLVRSRGSVPSAVSRECEILRSRSGLWSVAGGKYTTYRAMAEQVVNQIAPEFGPPLAVTACRTATHRLIGTPLEPWPTFRESEPARLASVFGMDQDLASHLVDRYGGRAGAVAERWASVSAYRQPVVAGEPECWAELKVQADEEMSQCAADHLLRRTRLGLFHPELLNTEMKWPCGQPLGTFRPSC